MTDGRPKLRFAAVLLLLAQVAALAWFGFFLFLAVVFFVFRGFADEPGALMTVPRALWISAKLVLLGAPGLLVAWGASRLRRRMYADAEQVQGFDVLPPK